MYYSYSCSGTSTVVQAFFKSCYFYDMHKTFTFFSFYHIKNVIFQVLRVNPNSLSYPFPFPLSFVRSCESKGCPNSHFDRGVGLRGRCRYPLKPSIFASLLETKGYPEYTAARSSRESHKFKYFRLKLFI